MTLPASGYLTMAQINAEFGRGNDLNAYRGTGWYNDAGGYGTFPYTPISFANFLSTRATSPHHPFGFDNFSGSPTRTNGDLTLSGYGVGLTAYGGARDSYGPYVEFTIDNPGCVVGLAASTPSDYPGGNVSGVGVRHDGLVYLNQPGYGSTGVGYYFPALSAGDIVSFYYTSGAFYCYHNGTYKVALNATYGGGGSYGVYPSAQVSGGQVTLRTTSAYGIGTYWYP